MVPQKARSLLIFHVITSTIAAIKMKSVDAAAATHKDNGCMGLLVEPCQCTPANISIKIECINAKFNDIDMDYFVAVGSGHFHALRFVTFHGNHFTYLPRYLFGSYIENVAGLETLNFSHNFIGNISKDSFCGLNSLTTLDLSDNKLILNSDSETDLSIFNPLAGSLKFLKMRNSFDQPLDSKLQLLRLKKSFESARFKILHFLDLSSNSFDYFPFDFLCSLHELRNLYLNENQLSTLHLKPTCFKNLKTLDLSKNRFKMLDSNFMATVTGLKSDYALKMNGNGFECNCNSTDYLEWIQKCAAKFEDVDNLNCTKASPKKYAGKSIINFVVFNLKDLDCDTPVDKHEAHHLSKILQFLLLLPCFLLSSIILRS